MDIEEEKCRNPGFMSLDRQEQLGIYRDFFLGFLAAEQIGSQEVMADYQEKLAAMRRLANMSADETARLEQNTRTLRAEIIKSFDNFLVSYRAGKRDIVQHQN